MSDISETSVEKLSIEKYLKEIISSIEKSNASYLAILKNLLSI